LSASTWLPWAVFVLGMFIVWTAIYLKTGSFRKATIGGLLVGKSYVIVYKLAGLDRTVATLYLVNRYGYVKEVHVTALGLLFLAFLGSLVVTLYWPVLTRRMPRELRTAFEEVES